MTDTLFIGIAIICGILYITIGIFSELYVPWKIYHMLKEDYGEEIVLEEYWQDVQYLYPEKRRFLKRNAWWHFWVK